MRYAFYLAILITVGNEPEHEANLRHRSDPMGGAVSVMMARLRAIRAVLPADLRIYAVGGVSPDNLADWQRAGAAGFGIGSSIFKPGQDAHETGLKATNFVAALNSGEQ
jgi:thiamine monophosphate synthase